MSKQIQDIEQKELRKLLSKLSLPFCIGNPHKFLDSIFNFRAKDIEQLEYALLIIREQYLQGD